MSRLHAAHMSRGSFQQSNDCSATRFQNVGFSLAPQEFIRPTLSRYTDGATAVFNMWLSRWRPKNDSVSTRMESWPC
eukprot:2898137-Pyramimonas_sp.AAC.1